MALVAEHLGDKLVLVILRNAFNGMKRFDDFYKHLGVSSKVCGCGGLKLHRRFVLLRTSPCLSYVFSPGFFITAYVGIELSF